MRSHRIYNFIHEIKTKSYSKIPKIGPEAYIFQRHFLRGLFLEGLIFGGGLSTEGNLRFKIDRASLLMVGSKFAVCPLFYCCISGQFPSTSPPGAYIWRGDLTEGFLRYEFRGLIFGGAYTRRGLFSEFYGSFARILVRFCGNF